MNVPVIKKPPDYKSFFANKKKASLKSIVLIRVQKTNSPDKIQPIFFKVSKQNRHILFIN